MIAQASEDIKIERERKKEGKNEGKLVQDSRRDATKSVVIQSEH